MLNPTPLLGEHEAARILGLSIKTLQAWRFQGRGPEFFKLGRAVRYRPEDLEQFLESCRVRAGEAA